MELFSVNLGLFLWSLLIFAVLVGALLKFAFGPLRKMQRERQDFINNSIHEAEKLRKDADDLLTEKRRRLSWSGPAGRATARSPKLWSRLVPRPRPLWRRRVSRSSATPTRLCSISAKRWPTSPSPLRPRWPAAVYQARTNCASSKRPSTRST
jgi:hypothetical protein